MLSFAQNNCRFCVKVFCCRKCRQKHEKKIHSIYPNCDICAYGSMVLKCPTDDLLEHIREIHWPLHCIDCNRVFGAIHEMILHNKCPLAKTENVRTPVQPKIKTEDVFEFNSSPVENTPFKNATPSGNEMLGWPKMIYLTTSTPRTDPEFLNDFDFATQSEVKGKTSEDFTKSVTTDDIKIKPKVIYLTSTPRTDPKECLNVFDFAAQSEIKSKTNEDFTESVTTDDIKIKPKVVYLTSTPRTGPNEFLNVFDFATQSGIINKTDEDFSKSITTDDLKNRQSKRTVTFNDTPIYDSFKKTPQEQKSLKSSLKKTSLISTPEMSQSPSLDNPQGSSQGNLTTPKTCPTIWETASDTPEGQKINESYASSMYTSCQSNIQIENISIESITESNIAVLNEAQKIFKKTQGVSIWTSMTCLVKSFVTGLSNSSYNPGDNPGQFETPRSNIKKRRADEETDKFLRLKKMKLTDIECRKPINSTVPYSFYAKRDKPKYCDKSTQTD